MARVLVIGVAVVDFVFAVDRMPREATKYRARDAEMVGGGCGANAAVAIARLGGEAMLGARIGDDPIADLILADLQDEGVDTSLVQRCRGGRSSFSSVLVDDRGDRQIVNFRGSSLVRSTDWIAAPDGTGAVLADTRWSDGALRAMELARRLGVPGVIDAEAPMEPAALHQATHVAFSRDGLLEFARRTDLDEALREAGHRLPGHVCVTDGGQGVLVLTETGIEHIPSFPVAVKDTLGAGDIWHGAFALALAERQPEMQAIRFANAAAALKCTEFGGRRGAPDRASVEDLLKETSK